MRIFTSLILTILISGCQPDSKDKKSETSYNKGIEILTLFSENEEHDYRKALNHLTEATRLNPKNITAQYWKADAELKLGKFDESLKTSLAALEEAESKNSLKPNFLTIAGISAGEIGKDGSEYFNEAITIYESRIEDDINDIDAILNKEIVLCYMGKKESAIAFLNTLSLNRENQAVLEKMKVDIGTFDSAGVLNLLTIEK